MPAITGTTLRSGAVTALLLLLFLQLLAVNRRTSMTWDEGHHLFDGYTILRHHDFGLNPEVPPLAKVVAALPLLPLRLNEPVQQGRSSQLEAFTDGRDFLFHNDADTLLLRSRIAISLLTLLLALLVFLAGQQIFGATTGLLALAFLAFDPLLLAHGALVTTDASITCLVFASVFAWYRYTLQPSPFRLLLTGIAVGLALAVKFTGLFLLPTLGLLLLAESLRRRSLRLALHRSLALLAVSCLAFVVLWTSYGFRYAARPHGLPQNPTLSAYLDSYAAVANPAPLRTLARWHALPEAYLWGLANTRLTEARDVSYLFGRIRRHGTWLYFPAAFLIKSTLPLLALLALSACTFIRDRELRWPCLLLAIPVLVFLAFAMHADMNIGVRHILPIYPFLYLLGASALATAIHRDRRRWLPIAAVLLLFQAATSLRAFPAYMAYANEVAGGPGNVHHLLSDSNSDWGQQLKTVATYLHDHHIHSCWMAYTASGVADPLYYGVRCQPLPTTVNLWWIPVPMHVPPHIDGTILLSDDELEGIDLPFGQPNPYEAFKHRRPDAILDGGVMVYNGSFDTSAASALVQAAHPASTP